MPEPGANNPDNSSEDKPKKIVLGPSGGKAAGPSDPTRKAPAYQDGEKPKEEGKPAARRTIKLKPLAKKPNASPSAKTMVLKAPNQGGSDSETEETSKLERRSVVPPAPVSPSTAIGNEDEEAEETVAIDRKAVRAAVSAPAPQTQEEETSSVDRKDIQKDDATEETSSIERKTLQDKSKTIGLAKHEETSSVDRQEVKEKSATIAKSQEEETSSVDRQEVKSQLAIISHGKQGEDDEDADVEETVALDRKPIKLAAKTQPEKTEDDTEETAAVDRAPVKLAAKTQPEAATGDDAEETAAVDRKPVKAAVKMKADDSEAGETAAVDRKGTTGEMPAAEGIEETAAIDRKSIKKEVKEEEEAEETAAIPRSKVQPPRPTSPSAPTMVLPQPKTGEEPEKPANVTGEEDVDDIVETVAMDRKSVKDAVPRPMPGAKQTIKLRPPTPTTPSGDGATAGKPASASTIKLKPKTPGEEAAAPEAKDAEPKAKAKQTIKLVPKKAATAKPSDPTVKVDVEEQSKQEAPKEEAKAPAKPSAPTIKLNKPPTPAPPKPAPPTPAPPDGAAGETPEAPAAGEEAGGKLSIKEESGGGGLKKKLSIKKEEKKEERFVEGSASPDGEQPKTVIGTGGGPKKKTADKDEPSILFVLSSLVALLTLAYLVLVLGGQYANQWEGQTIPVPAASEIAAMIGGSGDGAKAETSSPAEEVKEEAPEKAESKEGEAEKPAAEPAPDAKAAPKPAALPENKPAAAPKK